MMRKEIRGKLASLSSAHLLDRFNRLTSIEAIYNLCINNKYDILYEEKLNDVDLLFIGVYFYVKEDYDNAKKYYLKAIEKNNNNAMHNLGVLYEKLEDYNNAKKYYLLAIQHGNNYSMQTLGNVYRELGL